MTRTFLPELRAEFIRKGEGREGGRLGDGLDAVPGSLFLVPDWRRRGDGERLLHGARVWRGLLATSSHELPKAGIGEWSATHARSAANGEPRLEISLANLAPATITAARVFLNMLESQCVTRRSLPQINPITMTVTV